MITIELLYETVANEPGPNFYFRGSPHNYLDFVVTLHSLGEQDGVSITLMESMCIDNCTNKKITFCSNSEGKVLCSINDSEIVVELPYKTWIRVLEYMFSITFYPSTQYIEFDDLDLIEDANFIVESIGSSCAKNRSG
jgi:hypothetical protein